MKQELESGNVAELVTAVKGKDTGLSANSVEKKEEKRRLLSRSARTGWFFYYHSL